MILPLPTHRHRDAVPLLAVPPHVCLLRRLQLAPLLQTDELEPAPDLRLLIPRHKPLRMAAHSSKNEDACPGTNKPF